MFSISNICCIFEAASPLCLWADVSPGVKMSLLVVLNSSKSFQIAFLFSVLALWQSTKSRIPEVARCSWGVDASILNTASTALSFSWVSCGRNYHWKQAHGQLNRAIRVVVRAYRAIYTMGRRAFISYLNSWEFLHLLLKKAQDRVWQQLGMVWDKNWHQVLNSYHRYCKSHICLGSTEHARPSDRHCNNKMFRKERQSKKNIYIF